MNWKIGHTKVSHKTYRLLEGAFSERLNNYHSQRSSRNHESTNYFGHNAEKKTLLSSFRKDTKGPHLTGSCAFEIPKKKPPGIMKIKEITSEIIYAQTGS